MIAKLHSLCAAALICAIASPVAAADRSQLYGKEPSLYKVSSHLLEARQLMRQGLSLQEVSEQMPLIRARRGMLEVEVRLNVLDADTLATMRGLGIDVVRAFEDVAVVDALVDGELLDELAAIPEVTVIRPQYGAITNVGSVDNQADVSINADDARVGYGIDGTGVSIGVLSDSFGNTIGGSLSGSGCSRVLTGSAPQVSGDLPTQVIVLDDGASGSDEGAGMAELIHDLAPGSPLMFHTAFNSIADFADGITELRTCGADVIVDDVIYFAEPMFQDGLIAQAAQAAVDAGVPFYSSAGNQSTNGVDEVYSDVNPGTDDTGFPPSGDDLHDFGSGDEFAAITLPNLCGVRAVLQWNEPFSGTLGPGASTDLDLHLYDSPSAAGTILASSTDIQGCGAGGGPSGDPLEILLHFNSTGSAQTVYLAVEHFCGNETDLRFRIGTYGFFCNETSLTWEPGIFDKAQIYGHAAAVGAEAVAAVFYGEIDTGGAVDPPSGQIDVEPFSSIGGDLPFYFDGSGNPLPGAPVTRTKPEFAAPDGTNTTFFGSDIPYDADSFPNFFGTSAAAPHAAAVAALLLEAEPALTPAGLRSLMQSTAIDIETAGFDTLSGAGLIDARDAVSEVSQILELSPAIHDFGTVSVGGSASQTFTLANTAGGTAAVNVSSITLSDVTNYSLDSSAGGSPCGSTTPTLAAGSSCTFDVDFGPTSSSTFPTTLTVMSDAPTQTADLTGTGGVVGCNTTPDLTLENDTVTTTTEFLACYTITVGPSFAINSPGDVTFRTRDSITLRNGFSVGSGASFTAILDPTAGAP